MYGQQNEKMMAAQGAAIGAIRGGGSTSACDPIQVSEAEGLLQQTDNLIQTLQRNVARVAMIADRISGPVPQPETARDARPPVGPSLQSKWIAINDLLSDVCRVQESEISRIERFV